MRGAIKSARRKDVYALILHLSSERKRESKRERDRIDPSSLDASKSAEMSHEGGINPFLLIIRGNELKNG